MSDELIEERLLTMTGTSPERRDDHSLDSGWRGDGSVAMSENLPIALDPDVALLLSCVPKDMGRRSAVSA